MNRPRLRGARGTELLALAAALAAAPVRADITYQLNFDPASSPEAQQVANSVAVAAAFYNQHGSFNKHWSVTYHPGIPTAEGNVDGYMGYGGSRNERVVFHEAAHTFGMGTHWAYGGLLSGGVWQGSYGNQAQFDTYNAYADGLHGDGHAIWPGGFNFDHEDGYLNRFWHTRIMAGMRADLGYLSFTREALNESVVTGETAEFRVESPLAVSWQWQKDGANLANGGDISGANTATLRIANAESADAGTYRCVVTGAGETLNGRPRQLWVVAPATRRYTMDGNVQDSGGGGQHGTAFGSPAYVAGKIGQAFDLDGTDDYIQLPAAVALASEMTVATWVNWDGGGNWQRVFDFGTGTHQNIFLTPNSGAGMRLAFKDAINGASAEKQINTSPLPTGQWVHLAAVLHEDRATLYVNGQPVGSVFDLPIDPCHFAPDLNYIGKSQYADPLFNGRVDDFRVYNRALGGAEVWSLWGQNANLGPAFTQDLLTPAGATVNQPYAGQTLAGQATDPNGDTLAFSKLSGPAWLAVSANGTLSGTPASADYGLNRFFVRVADPSGATSDAELRINVGYSQAAPVAYWSFEEGTPGAQVPYTPGTAGQYDGSMLDASGNGNHLSAWTSGWHTYRAQVPSATIPRSGRSNAVSVQNANAYPAMSAIGTGLSRWSPPEWTIEAAIRPDDATNGFQAIVGRDSRGAYAADPALAALYFNVEPNGALRVMFTDAAGNNWTLTSAAGTVQDAKWHAVAATSDGDTLSLYLKNLTNGDPLYTLLGSLDISSSTNPALSTGTGDGSAWDPGVFTVSRGLWNGGHTDRFYGHIDEVRLYGKALAPDELLFSTPPAGVPPVPGGLVAAATSVSRIHLAWNPSSGATSYKVKRSATSGGPYTTVAPDVTTTSFDDAGLNSSTTYHYVVSAVNANGESVDSAEASATTLQAPPPPWTSSDIGAVGLAGSASYGSGTFNVNGSGTDIWGVADAFQFVSQSLTGDGEIRARVTSQSNSDPWAKAGVMIRDGGSAGAVNALVAITPSNGFTFQWRGSASGASSSVAGPALNAAPGNWVRLVRSGTLVTGYVSANGTSWTQVGTTTLAMAGTVSVGLAVTSHSNAALGTATFDNVSVTAFPSPWATIDIGATGLQGSAEFFGSAFTLKGAGTFGGTSDSLRYVYQTLDGNGTVIARVNTLGNTGANARVGIMMRDSLAANARMAALTVNGSGAWRWQRRTTTGGSVSTTNSSTGSAPNIWVRLARSGSTITASRSTNGSSWTVIGSSTVSLASPCYVGLAVASGSTTALNTSVLDNVSLSASAVSPLGDLDADGMPDAWEELYYNPVQFAPSGDLDGDGKSNGDEYTAGTDPDDSNDTARLTIVSVSPALFEFDGKVGRTYSLERLVSLENSEWEQIQTVGPLVTGGPRQMTDPSPPPARGIYRLQISLGTAP